MQKVWHRKHDSWWYATIARGGEQKQIKLHKGPNNADERKQAEDELIVILAARINTNPAGQIKVPKWLTARHVVTGFIAYAKRELPASAKWYERMLNGFADAYGNLKVRELSKRHVLSFAKKKYTNANSQNGAVAAVKRAFAWATEEEHIPFNPVSHVKKPNPTQPRERILEPEERKLIKGAIKDDAFRDYFTCLSLTGARPGEVARVTAADCDMKNGWWILEKHKTAAKTGRARIIYLPDEVVAITRRLMAKHPQGPIFLNLRGEPWTHNAIRQRFRRLRRKHPQLKGVIAYTLRHSFATDALERTVPDSSVAALLGHSSTRMLHSVYSKLRTRHDHLRMMATRATEDVAQTDMTLKTA